MTTNWSPYWRSVQNIPYLRPMPLASLVYMFFFAVVRPYMLGRLKNFVAD